MGLPKYKRQMQDAAIQPDVDDGREGWNSDFGTDAQLVPYPTSVNPPNVARAPLNLCIYDSIRWIWHTSAHTPQLTPKRLSNSAYMMH
jgi:hypothetical protein